MTVRIKPEMTVPQSESSGFFIVPPRAVGLPDPTGETLAGWKCRFDCSKRGQLNPVGRLSAKEVRGRAQRDLCLSL